MKLIHSLITTILGILLITSLSAQQRLLVSPDMLTNISAQGDAWILFDDQPGAASVSCPYPRTNNQWVTFDARWNGQDFFYPVSVIVDLGLSTNLNQICLRRSGGSGNVEVYAGGNNPTTWSLLINHQAGSADCQNLSAQTRFLKFVFSSTQNQVREIELYGPQINTPLCPPAVTSCQTLYDCNCPRPLMDRFIGSNTNLDIPPEKTVAVGFARNYQHSYFNEGYHDPTYPGYPNNEYTWSPTERPQYDHDHFYQGLHDLGVEICADVHKSPPYLTTFAYKNGNTDYTVANALQDGLIANEFDFIKVIERKPINEAIYPTRLDIEYDDPAIYLEYADVMYQLSARYGSPGNSQNLKVHPSNQPKSGLGLVQYLENWNEPDKWWHYFLVQNEPYLDPYVERRMAYFTPFEYAAMSSATYDGNGRTNGVENILRDRYPNGAPAGAGPVSMTSANGGLKLVMAGISEINIDFVKALKFWFDHYRPDISFPFEAINFHHYSNNLSATGQQPQRYGISPEADNLRERVRKAVEFRDQYLPGVEVWMSEFGYDTNPYSIQSPDCARFCGDCASPDCLDKMRKIQAQWVIRSFLEIAAGGADRAMVFNMRDGGPESDGTVYNSGGLNTWGGVDETGFDSKPSWYYLATLKNQLSGLRFDPTFQHSDPNVRIYRFVEDCSGSGKQVYAIWSPTEQYGNETNVRAGYQLPFLQGTAASWVEMTDGDVDGVVRSLGQCGGQYCIDVTETPKLIVVGDPVDEFQNCNCDYLTYQTSGPGNVSAINNEASQLGEPYCGDGNTMTTAWSANNNQAVVLDFGGMATLDHLFLYNDGGNNGQFDIYTGAPGNWQFFSSWNTTNPRPYKWKSYTQLNRQSRYIRIVSRSGNMRLQEVAICGKLNNANTPTCTDGVKNGNETGIDCGGNCPPCISCNDGIQNGNETGIDCGGNCPACPPPPGDCRITLSPAQFFNTLGQSASATNFGGSLADEQSLAGDPGSGNGGAVQTAWQFPWSNGVQTYLDLGQEYDLQEVHLFDGFGSGRFQVAPGRPAEGLAAIVDFDANRWPPAWRSFPVNVRTRYLTFTRVDGSANINEVVLCGTPAGNTGGPTCSDGIQNGNENGVDCGGNCPPCITCNDGIQNGNETGIDCGGNCPACPPPPGDCRITLTPGQFYDALDRPASEANFGGSLADEQNLAGDPGNGSGGAVQNAWQFPWSNGVQTYLDMGREYDLQDIHLFDGFGTGRFQVAPGKPADGLAPIVDFDANLWPPAWRSFTVDVRTRYLTFTRVDGSANINEVVLCGTAAGGTGGPNCNDGIQNGNEQGVDCGGNCPPCPPPPGDCRIPLTTDMVFNAVGEPDPLGSFGGGLVDEQNQAGQPWSGNGQTVNNPWQNPWRSDVQVYIDLGRIYNLESISLYDGYGNGRFQVSPGLPQENRAPIIDVQTDLWPIGWRIFDAPAQRISTRYLTFTRVDADAKINEVVLCGSLATAPADLSVQSQISAPKLNDCSVSIYPNPVMEELKLNSQSAFTEAVITDLFGRMVWQQQWTDPLKIYSIDLSELTDGIYFIQLNDDDSSCRSEAIRFVKMGMQ